MAYEKTIWKNREVERPRTFEKIENPDGTITLVPAEGNIIEPGTPIIAENMNKIEQGIKDAHDEIVAHKADNFHHIPYVIATGTNSYAVNIQGITALTEGMSVKVKFTSANTGACTLNINGLGAKEIRKSNGNSLSAGNIKAGQILHLVYTGSVFQLLGEGGEYGTAQPNHVLEGYTIGTEEGIKSGTMPNRGAVTNTITTQGGSYTIPQGYHNGSGRVTANFVNLVPENVKQGVNIGGVVGTFDGVAEPLVLYQNGVIPGDVNFDPLYNAKQHPEYITNLRCIPGASTWGGYTYGYVTKSAIDLTPYRILKFEGNSIEDTNTSFDVNSYYEFGVASSDAENLTFSRSMRIYGRTSSARDLNVSVDVSDLNSPFFIKVIVRKAETSVSEWWGFFSLAKITLL